MRRTSLFAHILQVLLLIGAASAAARAQTITGTVTDADRNLLPSMVVAAYRPDPACSTKRVVCWKNVANVTTDASGHYTMASINAGSYRVLAYDPTGAFATQFSANAESFDVSPLTVLSGTESVSVNFALVRGAAVNGTVLTSGGTRPDMVVAAYNLSGTRRGFTKTDLNGIFSMILPPGNYKLLSYDESGLFATSFFRDQQDFANATTVTTLAGRPLTGVGFFLPIGAHFNGVVRDASGVPIEGATVYAYNSSRIQVSSVYTSAEGKFSMTLPGGTYRFVAADESGVYAAGFLNNALSFDSSPELTLGGGQSRADLTFRLQQAGRVAGTVTDARTGASLAGMTVAAYNADGTLRTSVTTDSSGHYELLLPTASFFIAAWDPDLNLAPQFYPLRNAYRDAVPVAVSPNSNIVLPPFALRQAGRFSGTVREQNGNPVAGAVVAAYDSDGGNAASATTNSLGAYRFALEQGSYRLLAYDPQTQFGVSYAGGTSYDDTAARTISAGVEETVDFTVSRGTRVSGTITDTAGRAVGGAEVTAYSLAGGRVASARTIDDGTFELALVPGVFRFGVRDLSGRYPAAFLGGESLRDATPVTVTATAAPAINVTLRVVTHRRAVGR